MFGAVVTLLLFPICGDPARLRLKRDWSAALVDAFVTHLQQSLPQILTPLASVLQRA